MASTPNDARRLTLLDLPKEILQSIFRQFYAGFDLILVWATPQKLCLKTSPISPALACHYLHQIALDSMRCSLSPHLDAKVPFETASQFRHLYKDDRLRAGRVSINSLSLRLSGSRTKPLRNDRYWNKLIESCPKLTKLQITFWTELRHTGTELWPSRLKDVAEMSKFVHSGTFHWHFDNQRSRDYNFWWPDFQGLMKTQARILQTRSAVGESEQADKASSYVLVIHELRQTHKCNLKDCLTNPILRNSWLHTADSHEWEISREIQDIDEDIDLRYLVEADAMAIINHKTGTRDLTSLSSTASATKKLTWIERIAAARDTHTRAP